MKPINLKALRDFRPGKTWIVLGVALAIGGVAALAARSYLTKQMEAIESRSQGKTVMAVVAKTDIGKGVRLSNENVAMRAIPVEFAHSVAVTPGDFERINGQMLAYPVKSGEMILWGLIETQKVPTFSARVEAGRRAMTVPVDEINSISGLLEPGDMIDLMVSTDQKGKKITFPLLQSVQVMATGQRSVDDPKSGEKRQFSTVTINTTPEQAQNLIVAREVGKLTALLRNPQDQQAIGNTSYDIAALLGLKGDTKIANRDVTAVPVLYGGSLAALPPESLKLSQYTMPSREQGAVSAPPPVYNNIGALKP